MLKFFKYILAFAWLLILSSCNNEALENAMVSFDQAFIPVFYYTYTEDLDRAEKAMIVLNRKWERLSVEFEEEAANAHNWQASFQMVTNWLDEADCAIESKQADIALVQLDHARYELMDLRWREGIDYYLDRIWDLEAAIDIVVQTSSDPMLDLIEWQTFMMKVYNVEQAWGAVLNSTWEEKYFEFDTLEIAEEKNRKLALGLAIKNFTRVVDYADRCEIEDAAKEMEIAYLEYIFFFGDFDATATFFAAS